MPQMPMRSARGARGRDSMFSSTISTSQPGGQSAASVARPSGGFIARLPDNILSSAHLKLQKLSSNLGFMRSKRISAVAGWIRLEAITQIHDRMTG